MQLSDLSFEYDIASGKLDFLQYFFMDNSSEINEANQFFKSLERILDLCYLDNPYVKSPKGTVSDHSIDAGYQYKNKDLQSLTDNGHVHVNLTKKQSLNQDGNVKEARVVLFLQDASYKRTLSVYDAILAMEKLDFSKDSQVQINRLNTLIKDGFNVEKYLELPPADICTPLNTKIS